MPQVCVGLFTAKEHRLLATTETDSHGYFELRDIPRGDYRIIAKVLGFCAANVPVRIDSHRGKRKVLLHIRPEGIDTCSWGDYK